MTEKEETSVEETEEEEPEIISEMEDFVPTMDDHWFCHRQHCYTHFTTPKIDKRGVLCCPICGYDGIELESRAEK